jgi:hypothetical protein
MIFSEQTNKQKAKKRKLLGKNVFLFLFPHKVKINTKPFVMY